MSDLAHAAKAPSEPAGRAAVDAPRPATGHRRALVRVGAVALVAIAVLVPFSFSDYSLFQFSRVMTLGMAVLALNLLLGQAGQISVGHGALLGIGAYATVILMNKASVPYPLALVAATAVCFVAGAIVGLPALRLRGFYLGLVTLGLAIVLPGVIKEFEGLTGGVSGIGAAPPEAPGGIDLTPAQWLYLVDLAVLIVVLVVVGRLTRGRVGRAMDALRRNELMATAYGVRLGRLKTAVFAVSAAITGLGGGLYQLTLGTATPDSYTLMLSLLLLAAACIGGLRSRWGAIVGAAFVVYVPDVSSDVNPSASQLMFAVALLAAIYLLPDGIAGLPPRLLQRVGRWRRSAGSTTREES
jgi:branched-chain amino acid transport system permease protein